MTLSTTASRIAYAGDGTTVAFATDFPFIDPGDLAVLVCQADGIEAVQAVGTDYTVAGGDGAAGTVTMTVAPQVGETLVIRRAVPATQEVDYTVGEKFPAETHERALDKLTMIAQQLATAQARSVAAGDGHDLSDVDLRLPAPFAPGKALGIDSAGTGFALIDLDITVDSSALVVVAGAPPAHQIGRLWVDTGTPNTLILKHSDGADWITLITVDTTNDSATMTLADGQVTGAKIAAGAVGANQLATAVDPLGKQTIWAPAGALVARETNGAEPDVAETATHKVMRDGFLFDAGADEFVQLAIRMPEGWDEGTIDAVPVWTAESGSGGVAWAVQAAARSDGEAIDAAFGTAVVTTDTLQAAGEIHVAPATAAITVGGTPAAGDWVAFQLYRDVSDGADTLAVDAWLLGLTIRYTVDAASDG